MRTERFGFVHADKAANYVRERCDAHSADTSLTGVALDGVILGTGLGNFADTYLPGAATIGFADIFRELGIEPGKSAVEGHAQKLIIGRLKGEKESPMVIAQSGREHLYEGIDVKRATFWLRVMQLLGVQTLTGSNASGILTPDKLSPGDLMLVHSDLDWTGDNPLIGLNDERFGPQFPHMGDHYPQETRDLIKSVAEAEGVPVIEGIYVRVTGPNYERREDVYNLRSTLKNVWHEGGRLINNDSRFKKPTPVGVVGMSSTYEALVAQHATQSKHYPAFRKARAWISVPTNYAAALGPDGVAVGNPNHEEVQEAGRAVQDRFGRLVYSTIMEFAHRRKTLGVPSWTVFRPAIEATAGSSIAAVEEALMDTKKLK